MPLILCSLLSSARILFGEACVSLQEGEKRLYNDVSDAEDKVHQALLDSINTKEALAILTDLMAAVNRYMLAGQHAAPFCLTGLPRHALQDDNLSSWVRMANRAWYSPGCRQWPRSSVMWCLIITWREPWQTVWQLSTDPCSQVVRADSAL